MYEDIIKKLTMICDNTKVDYICVIYKLSSVFEITGYEIIEYCGMKTTESLSIKIINKQKQITFSCDMNSLEDTLKEQITSLTDIEDNPFITVPDHSIIKKAVKMGSDYTVDEIKELYNYIKNQIVEFMKQNKHIDDFKCENNNASSIQTQYIVIDNLGLQSIQTFNHASVDASIISPKYKKDCCCYPQIKNKTDCYKEIDIMLQRTFYDILDQLNPVAIPSGNYPCILGPEVTLNIIGHFINLLKGENIVNQNSFFKDKLNTMICNPAISITERPIYDVYEYLVDDEGEPLSDKSIVKDGILQSFILNTQNSKRLHLTKSGNGFHFTEDVTNLVLESNNYYEMKDITEGIYVNSIISPSLNYSNGDYGASITGYKIINGKRGDFFENATISFNLLKAMSTMALIKTYDNNNNIIHIDNSIYSHLIFLSDVKILCV